MLPMCKAASSCKQQVLLALTAKNRTAEFFKYPNIKTQNILEQAERETSSDYTCFLYSLFNFQYRGKIMDGAGLRAEQDQYHLYNAQTPRCWQEMPRKSQPAAGTVTTQPHFCSCHFYPFHAAVCQLHLH